MSTDPSNTTPVNPLTPGATPPPPPVPAMDTPPPQDPEQAAQDQGMYEAGIPGAVERRLLHIDRVTEETLVQARLANSQTLALMVGVTIVGVMLWMIAKELRGLDLGAIE